MCLFRAVVPEICMTPKNIRSVCHGIYTVRSNVPRFPLVQGFRHAYVAGGLKDS